VVLPKPLRNARKWGAGRRFEIVETSDGVLLRAEPLFPPKTIDEVFGCLKYDGPPISIEDMDRGIAEAVMEEYLRGHY
jgi:bifunctional DNA-binding transcriptional regulator/antitoxin component of YhaV-PrlF toxin-antitoxin module